MLVTEFCLTVLAVVAPAIVFLLSAIYDALRKIREELAVFPLHQRYPSEQAASRPVRSMPGQGTAMNLAVLPEEPVHPAHACALSPEGFRKS